MKKFIAIIAILSFVAFGSSVALAGSASDASSTANSQINNTINFPQPLEKSTVDNNGHGYRGFNITPQMTYPGMPTYFGNATRNGNVQPVKAIIYFKDTFTRAELCKMLDQKMKDGANADDTITIVVVPPAKDQVLQKGLITMEATNTDTGSKVVLFKAALSALNFGGNIFFVTAEGAGTQLHSFGWGVGLAYTYSRISSGENAGSTGSGGMGVSGGTAGYGSLPWVQGIALHTK